MSDDYIIFAQDWMMNPIYKHQIPDGMRLWRIGTVSASQHPFSEAFQTALWQMLVDYIPTSSVYAVGTNYALVIIPDEAIPESIQAVAESACKLYYSY